MVAMVGDDMLLYPEGDVLVLSSRFEPQRPGCKKFVVKREVRKHGDFAIFGGRGARSRRSIARSDEVWAAILFSMKSAY